MEKLQHGGQHKNLEEDTRNIEDVLELPNYMLSDLRTAGIYTMGQLLSMTESDLVVVRKTSAHGWGKGTIRKLQNALIEAGESPLYRVIPNK